MLPPRLAGRVVTGLLGACACGSLACGESMPTPPAGAAASGTPLAAAATADVRATTGAQRVLAELMAARFRASFAGGPMKPTGAAQRDSRLGVELPAAAHEPLRLSTAAARDPNTGRASRLGVEVRPLLEATPRHRAVAQQLGDAHVLDLGASSWVLWRNGTGVEDFWRIPTPTSPGAASVYPNLASALRRVAVRYELALSEVAGLRLVDSVLEFLDFEGTPRLRMRAPYAFDALGERWPVSLSVLDCQVDRSPAAPWRRAVTPPGNDVCRVRLSFDAAAEFPVWVDPQWTATGSLATPRTRAIQLGSEYSAVGGLDAQGEALASVERYDPVTGTWAMTGSLAAPRADAQEIGFPGKVLVVGGGVPFAERYDGVAQTWEAAGATSNRVGCGTRFRSPLGGVAVFVGAPDASAGPVQVEFQTSGGEWQVALADNPPSFREGATCHETPAGQGKAMLWLGGREPSTGLQPTSTWILRPDPSFAQGAPLARVIWEPGPDIAAAYPRGVIGHAGVWTVSGWQILGGQADGVALDSAASITTVAGEFSFAIQPGLPRPVFNASVINTANGVWLAGGVGALGEPLADVYLQDASDGVWRQQPSLLEARQGAQIAPLLDDGVLAVGGEGVAGVLASVEVFAGGLGAPCGKNADCRADHCNEGICCDAACDGPCETCRSMYFRPGMCVLAAIDDPTPRCTGDTSAICPSEFICGAAGECITLHAFGDCGTTCSDGLETRRTCNEGRCLAGLYSCGGYPCDGDRCGKSCEADAGCAADYFCRANVCVPLTESCGDCYGYPCDPIKRQCDTRCSSNRDCDSFDECRDTAVGKRCLARRTEGVGACGLSCAPGAIGFARFGMGPFGFGLMCLVGRRRRRRAR